MGPQTANSPSHVQGGLNLLWILPGLLLRSLGCLYKHRGPRCAALLSYFSFLGIVPLVIALVLTFQWFPSYQEIGQQILDAAYRGLNITEITLQPVDDTQVPELLTDHINARVQDGFSHFNQRVVFTLSLVLALLAAWGGLLCLQRAMNRLWHTSDSRDMILRLVNFWVLLTLSPVLLALGVYLMTHYRPTGLLGSAGFIEPYILLFATVVLGLFILYYVLPKADVQAGCSLVGALVATILLGILAGLGHKYVFTTIPTHWVNGLLGLLPLTVIGTFLLWWVVLYGAQISAALQTHYDRIQASQDAGTTRQFMASDVTVISILREILRQFELDGQPVPSVRVLGRLSIPERIGESILNHLVNDGILIRATEPTKGYVPAPRIKNMQLSEVAALVAKVSYGQPGPVPTALDHLAEQQQNNTSQTKLGDVLEEPTEQQPEQ